MFLYVKYMSVTLLACSGFVAHECLLVRTEPIRKLPFVEKQSRLDSQRKKLPGLPHTPEQQPSHSLIDAVYNIVESGNIVYVHPRRCHSRENEVQTESKNKSKTVITLKQGALKQTVISSLQDLDTSTELKLNLHFREDILLSIL